MAGEWWTGFVEKRFPVLAIFAGAFPQLPRQKRLASECSLGEVGWSRTSGQERLVKNGHRSREELLKSRTFLASANEIDEMLAAKKHKLA